MNINGQIQYLTQQQIDKEKWDACIAASANRLIYGYTFYLDHMAGQWDALVLNGYEAVMPLTWRRKWLISYLYQPAFMQQLGIFSTIAITDDIINAFLLIANRQFRFAEIFLNTANRLPGLALKTNLVLSLQKEYDAIYPGYTKNAGKNLRRSEKLGLAYSILDDYHEALSLFKNNYGARIKHITNADYNNFKSLCRYAQQNKLLVLRKATDEKQNLLAAALLLQKDNRLYLLHSVTLPEGRKKEANYFLVDNIIKEFSGKAILLDFEGSDIPDIAYFYKSFGAQLEPYYFYRHNDLPWPLSLFK